MGQLLLALVLGCSTREAPRQAPREAPPEAAPAPTPRRGGVVEIAVEASHELPDGAPSALAYMPQGFVESEPYDLVVFLHGWSGCVEVLMREGPTPCREGGEERPGWGLGRTLSAEQRVILMPQLAFRRRDGDAGRFGEAAFTRDWLGAALSALDIAAPAHIVVMAHSAGFETAEAWLRSDVPVDAVLLMDALYAKTPEFYAWASAAEGRQLISFYTGGSTGRQSRRLARMAQRDGAEDRVRRIRTRARHADVPAVEGPGALGELFQHAHDGEGVGAADESLPGGLVAEEP